MDRTTGTLGTATWSPKSGRVIKNNCAHCFASLKGQIGYYVMTDRNAVFYTSPYVLCEKCMEREIGWNNVARKSVLTPDEAVKLRDLTLKDGRCYYGGNK